jgi:hypothetical protein
MQMPIGAGGFTGKVVYMAAPYGFGFAGGSRVTMGMTVIITGFAFIVMFMAWNIGSGFGNPPDQMPVAIVNQSICAVVMNVISYRFARFFTAFVMMMSFAHISLLLDSPLLLREGRFHDLDNPKNLGHGVFSNYIINVCNLNSIGYGI